MSIPAYTAEEHNLRLMSRTHRYNAWIFDLLKLHLHGGPVLEVGAGVGNLTRYLVQHGGEITCTDINRRNLEELAVHCPGVRIVLDDLAQTRLTEQFDTIVCVNVLEHIADDIGALRNLHTLLTQDGRLLLLVPAVSWAFGGIDEADGHQRRYSQRDLRVKLAAAGFEILHMRYMNAPGLVGWWWEGRVLKRRVHGAGALGLFDRLVPLVRAVERFVPPPLGLSILAVARRRRGLPEKTADQVRKG